MAETALEAVGPAAEPVGGWDKLSLVLLVGDYLGNLSLDILGVGWLTSKALESLARGFDVSSLDEVSWRVWQEHETASEDDSPSELDSDWDSVGTSVGSVLCSIDHARSEQQTDGNAELISCNQGTTDFLWTLSLC